MVYVDLRIEAMAMTILDLLDKVERGDYRDDRYPLVIEDVLPVDPFRISHTYTLEDALQHAQAVLSR